MTKATSPRVRQVNLYTVEQDGQPVAQAMAISQADAVRLYVESQQQPVLSARLSSPLEARSLAGLPLLQRELAVTDTRTADLFGDAPAADHVEDSRAMVEPLAAGGFAPCGRALGDCGKSTQTCGCGVELAEMPPQPAMHPPRLEALGDEEPAAEQPGEPAGCLDAAPTAGEPAGASSAVDDDGGRQLTATARAGGKIVAKYRNQADGSTWTGRGLKPKWLVQALEDGRTQDKFLIDQA